MTCPSCGSVGPEAAAAGDVMVCGMCGETVTQGRKAVYADVHRLSLADMQRLRDAHARVIAQKASR